MKALKNIVLIFLIFIVSCSSDESSGDMDNNGNPQDTFDFQVDVTADAFEVDKPIKITIESVEVFQDVCISFTNWNSSMCRQNSFPEGLGTSIDIYTSIDKIGIQDVSVRVIKEVPGSYVQKDFQIEITRGNAVKITETKVISFFNIDQTWDDEFPDTDINRLADVNFAFEKQYIKTSFDEIEYASKVWYISDVIMNQGNLTWDLTNEELYIDPNLDFYFSLGDDDGGGIGQDLMLGPPFSLPYELINDVDIAPDTVSLIQNSIDLEVEFKLNW